MSKLNVEKLKVQSFVTSLEKKKNNTIMGGNRQSDPCQGETGSPGCYNGGKSEDNMGADYHCIPQPNTDGPCINYSDAINVCSNIPCN